MRKSATVAITSFLSFPLLLGFDVFRVAARLISGVRDAAGGIELREGGSEALSSGEGHVRTDHAAPRLSVTMFARVIVSVSPVRGVSD